MRNLLLFICILALTGMATSACSELRFRNESQEETANNDLKVAVKEALEEIQQAKEKAINSINSALNEKLQSNFSQTDSTMNHAIDEFKKLAEKERKKISNQLESVKEKTQSNQLLIIVSYLVLLTIIVYTVYNLSRNNQVKKSSTKTDFLNPEQKQLIKDWIKDECGKNAKTTFVNPQDIEHIIHNYCYDDNFKEYIHEIMREVWQDNRHHTAVTCQDDLKQSAEPSPQTEKVTTDKAYILYARESRTKELEISGKDYQKGKSLYKLILDLPDSSTATLDLCLSEEGATEQIIKRDVEYLGDICSVHRKTYSPTTVKVIEKGTAEKRDNNIWEVTKQIKVVFE